MADLDKKVNEYFPGLVVRKDLTKLVKGNAIVPSYVLEYLLGQYCATDDDATVFSGVERVKEILAEHYVHRNEAGLVRSKIREKGHHKVIDRISVDLNAKTDCYEATFSNLAINRVLIDPEVVKKHKRLLVGGVWCISDVGYQYSEDARLAPWVMNSIKPIQISNVDMEQFIEGRKRFSMDEWIDLIVQTIGFKPDQLSRRNKFFQLCRLVAYCERNFNLIELGPKGTGKSHLFSEFSPNGMLLSGGEVSVPKLFVNNSTGKIGLVGYWDTIGFDEFAGRQKKVKKNLVDILKNYMANKSFSRGIETLGAEASIVFLGNTKKSVPYMLKHTDLFEELPDEYRDTAFLDRLHCYVPGWEVETLRGEMFSSGYGFIVDYYAEILKNFRDLDLSLEYRHNFEINSTVAQRDLHGVKKTFSGLMKILFPHKECTEEEMREILTIAMESRKRVKDQLLKMDETYQEVTFSFTDRKSGEEYFIKTLEEEQYPQFFRNFFISQDQPEERTVESKSDEKEEPEAGKNISIREGQKGVSYQNLFGKYLEGASDITIYDPYIRTFYQTKNLSEFIQMVLRNKPIGEEVQITLVTKANEGEEVHQDELLTRLHSSLEGTGILFDYQLDPDESFHDRSIVTDTGWKIVLGRGLDIFQPYDFRDAFNLANNLQEERQCKSFEVTFVKKGDDLEY